MAPYATPLRQRVIFFSPLLRYFSRQLDISCHYAVEPLLYDAAAYCCFTLRCCCLMSIIFLLLPRRVFAVVATLCFYLPRYARHFADVTGFSPPPPLDDMLIFFFMSRRRCRHTSLLPSPPLMLAYALIAAAADALRYGALFVIVVCYSARYIAIVCFHYL